MQKKILIQIFLIIIILTISIFIYTFYFKEKKISKNIKISNNEISAVDNKKINTIYDIEYLAEDVSGAQYLIKSKSGVINEIYESGKSVPSEIIDLENVEATITRKNLTPINIKSDGATYNSLSYDTNFYGNVITTYENNSISSNYLDLYFERNLLTISDEVNFKNLNTNLLADKVEINLLSKNSKIFMNNQSRKVKIINKK